VSTIAERVRAGAAWLDEHEPGWVDRINLDRLDLSSQCRCVLGQLDGDYLTSVIQRGLSEKYDVGTPFGFSLCIDEPDSLWPTLTAAWRELIDARRATPGGAS
jgi:hypothetical protein